MADQERPLRELDVGISDYLRGMGAIPMADAFDRDFSEPGLKYQKLQKLLKGDVPTMEDLVKAGFDSMQALEQQRQAGLTEEGPAPVAPGPEGGLPVQEEGGALDAARQQQEELRRMLQSGEI